MKLGQLQKGFKCISGKRVEIREEEKRGKKGKAKITINSCEDERENDTKEEDREQKHLQD